MTKKENKTKIGVSLDRETVINQLQPLFEKWNDETHKPNECCLHFIEESPKWETDRSHIGWILEDILNGRDVEEVLRLNLPQHSEDIENYDYQDYVEEWLYENIDCDQLDLSDWKETDVCEDIYKDMEEQLREELDHVGLDWSDWENTESHQEIHQLLTQIQQDQKVQMKEVA